MKLALVTCHFNPSRYTLPVANYFRFREQLGPLAEKLTTIELVLDDDPPDIPDATIHLRGTREKHLMWQKERLLNIAFEQVPGEFDALAWLDHDTQFLNPRWYETACDLLERVAVVQLYDKVAMLNANSTIASVELGAIAGNLIGKNGEAGLAWAARREVLEGLGLPDRNIAGGGDTLALGGFVGRPACTCASCLAKPPGQIEYREKWRAAALARTQRRVSYVPGSALHYYHGERSDRGYRERHVGLDGFGFDPLRDVRIGAEGLLEFTGNKPEMQAFLASYFDSRKEDGRDAAV